MLQRHEVFIDGRWQPSDGTELAPVVNPATEQVFGTVTVSSPLDVDRAVQAADRALRAWAATPLDERREIVGAIKDGLLKRADHFAWLASSTLGQPHADTRMLGAAPALIDMYLESLDAVRFEYLRTDSAGTTLVTRRPVGVVAGITPWNTPLRSEVKKAIPALLSGCTVVLKPAPQTPFSAAAFAEVAAEAGVPDGVLNVVFGAAAAGEALVRHPLVRKVAFTGSTATGSAIGAHCGATFKRMQLELGGKSAAVVLPDADLDQVLPALARGNFYGTGQMCVALSRVLAPRARYQEIVDGLADHARAQVLGDPFDERTTMGPLVTAQQRSRVLDYVAIARAQGAGIVTGGGPPAALERGWYVEPTVLSAVDNDMRIAREEIFGPVASVIAYDSEDDAIGIANSSDYGLHGAVFSADEEHALSVARLIESGSVGVNRFGTTTSAPFGGIKRSGVGREHGPEGYDSFLEYVPYTISPELARALPGAGQPPSVSWGAA